MGIGFPPSVSLSAKLSNAAGKCGCRCGKVEYSKVGDLTRAVDQFLPEEIKLNRTFDVQLMAYQNLECYQDRAFLSGWVLGGKDNLLSLTANP